MGAVTRWHTIVFYGNSSQGQKNGIQRRVWLRQAICICPMDAIQDTEYINVAEGYVYIAPQTNILHAISRMSPKINVKVSIVDRLGPIDVQQSQYKSSIGTRHEFLVCIRTQERHS